MAIIFPLKALIIGILSFELIVSAPISERDAPDTDSSGFDRNKVELVRGNLSNNSDNMASEISTSSKTSECTKLDSGSTYSSNGNSSSGFSFSHCFNNVYSSSVNIPNSMSSFFRDRSSDIGNFFDNLANSFADNSKDSCDEDSGSEVSEWNCGELGIYNPCDETNISGWDFDLSLPSGYTSLDCFHSMNSASFFSVPNGCTSLDCIRMNTHYCSGMIVPEETEQEGPCNVTNEQETPGITSTSEAASNPTTDIIETVYSTESSMSTTLVTISCTTCTKSPIN